MSCSNPNKEIKQLVGGDTLTISADAMAGEDLSEEELTMTDIVEPKGTQVLRESSNTYYTMESSSYSLSTVSLTVCEPNSSDPENLGKNHEIWDVERTDSTLSINFSVVAKCGSDFLCEVAFVKPNTLNLIYHPYGSLAYCNCCHGLRYNFWILGYDMPEYRPYPEINYVMFNGADRVRI